MKKIKIMLMSLLVIAAVGGALAFKVKSRGLLCGTTSTFCPTPDNIHKLRFANPGEMPIDTLYCTDNPQWPPNVCVTVTVE